MTHRLTQEVLNGSYGDFHLSQVKQIEVWYDAIKKKMGFVINGKNQGKAATINAKAVYGYMWAAANGNTKVFIIPKEGEMLLNNFRAQG